MKIIPDKIQKYAESHTTSESKLLSKINRETHLKMIYPRMISGHHQGRLLSMISQMIKPQRILEIGTFTGYSAICLSEGLSGGGLLDSIEINEENEEMILAYLDEANIRNKVDLHFGRADEIIPKLNFMYDLVFLDADKENYVQYFNLIFDKINPGGIILADNVLWSGKVIDRIHKDKESVGIRKFNEMIQKDNRVENVLLTLRDGLMMIRKK